MYYFVIGADGNRYGPADIDSLVQWTREGRIVAATILIERGTDKEMPADSITAIAAELRRSGSAQPQEPGVIIERDEPRNAGEAQTMTRMPAAPPPPPPPGHGASPPIAAPAYPYGPRVVRKSRVVAGLLGIFLGGLGAHRFYLGYTGIGILMLVLSLAFGGCIPIVPGFGFGAVAIWGMVEGIICLCGGMRDADGHDLTT